MFDNLKSPQESEEIANEVKRTEAPLGQSNNVPANLASTFGANLGSAEAMNTRPANQGLGEEFNNRMQELATKGKKRGIKFSRMGIVIGSVIGLVMMGVAYYILTDVIGITEKAQESAINVENIGRDNNREKPDASEPVLTSTMKECELDEDCIIVQGGCCNCENGGIQIGMNVDFAEAWKTELDTKCKNAECTENSQCFPGRLYCEERMCKFVADENMIGTTTEAIVATSTEACIGDTCPIDQGIGEGNIVENTDNVWVSNPNLTDSDNDGLNNADEATLGLDMNNPDSDGDGLFDGDELKLKTNPLNSDSDGDGYGDGSEVAKGYNPLGDGLLNQQ
ncbi:MAG: hypothetical protein Q7T50_08035 [Candidatus Magasanikbacteria bacterium]|nr:hypothetical protein [Candidatus Magasanikbacteria bacterium]